jgi:hypothetical protein
VTAESESFFESAGKSQTHARATHLIAVVVQVAGCDAIRLEHKRILCCCSQERVCEASEKGCRTLCHHCASKEAEESEMFCCRLLQSDTDNIQR